MTYELVAYEADHFELRSPVQILMTHTSKSGSVDHHHRRPGRHGSGGAVESLVG
jgi:hypothetical protein